MAKPRNPVGSVVLRVTTTPHVKAKLGRLVKTGLYGKNIAEAAERLIAQGLEERLRNEVISKLVEGNELIPD